MEESGAVRARKRFGTSENDWSIKSGEENEDKFMEEDRREDLMV